MFGSSPLTCWSTSHMLTPGMRQRFSPTLSGASRGCQAATTCAPSPAIPCDGTLPQCAGAPLAALRSMRSAAFS